LKNNGEIDSKYKFVLVASKRAKELLKGAKPKIKSKYKSLIRLAQDETKLGLIDYEIIPPKKEEIYEAEDEVFIGEAIEEPADEAESELEQYESEEEEDMEVEEEEHLSDLEEEEEIFDEEYEEEEEEGEEEEKEP